MGEEKKRCAGLKTIAEKTEGMTEYPGYYKYYWDEKRAHLGVLKLTIQARARTRFSETAFLLEVFIRV